MIPFVPIVLGHLVGDYLLQPKKMALYKSDPSNAGFEQCLMHCVLYTAAICLLSWHCAPLFIAMVFLSHWFIDRYSLALHWLRMIRGRTWENMKLDGIDPAFTAVVYTVADNTMHLLLLWGVVLYGA